MPPVIKRPPFRSDPMVTVPPRVAYALRPSEFRAEIPVHEALSTNIQPYAGELREQQTHSLPQNTGLPVGATISMVQLRRPWNFVGFLVDPGDASAVGLVAHLRIITRGLTGSLPATPITFNGGVQAFVGLVIGNRCELTLTNGTNNPVFGLKASIWGMSER